MEGASCLGVAVITQLELVLSTQAGEYREIQHSLPPSPLTRLGPWAGVQDPSLLPSGTREQRADLASALLLTAAAAPGARHQVTVTGYLR